MNNIQVSVITCLYNTPPKLFYNCLFSILNQTFNDYEVIIVNDGSEKYLEENKKIIESFNDDRLKYFDTEHTGKAQTLNYAFTIAKGKYIAICDSDDQMINRRLEYQYNFLENNDYDVISNAMVTDDNHIIFPSTEESHEVHDYDIAYSCMHPAMMLNRNNVLNKVPFLFSQIYDSMEDAVFNFIMFYYGVKMWYDNTILQIYSHKNENSVHYENVNMKLKRDYMYKLRYQTFNCKSDNYEKTTVILLVNDNWGTDIEKTILNLKMTANNIKIIVVDYSDKKLDLSYLNKYNVNIINNLDDNIYSSALINGVYNCTTKYCLIISKPFRFLIQDWDLEFERFSEQSYYSHSILQPYMYGFDKIDENNYINENGKKIDKDIRCGQNFHLLNNIINSKLTDIYTYSEYIYDTDIPIIDNDLIFFTNTEYLKSFINGIILFDLKEYIANYISIAATLIYGWIKICLNIKGVVLNNDFEYYSKDNYNILYYKNMFNLICMFCNESKYIYEKILYDSFENKDIPKYIINNHLENLENFNKIKESINFAYDMSYFLKKNNSCKQWVLTHQAY